MNSQAGKRLKSPAACGPLPPLSRGQSKPSRGPTLNPPKIPGVLPEWRSGATATYWWGEATKAEGAEIKYGPPDYGPHNHRLAVLYKGKWAQR